MGYHNGSIKEWYKPYMYPYSELQGNEEHKSCWDCGNIRLRGQFNRRCDKHHEVHIWSGDAENELLQDPKDSEKTQADLCDDYFLNPDLDQVIKEREERIIFD